MINKNVINQPPQSIVSMVIDDDHTDFEDPLSLKYKVAEEIQRSIKNHMSLSLNVKEQMLFIKMESNKYFKDQKENIKLKDFRNYLNDLVFSFYSMADNDDFHNGYIILLKAQKIVSFIFKKNRSLIGEKEWLISHLNEIVFLQLNGLNEKTGSIYKSILSFFKMHKNAPRKSSIGGMSDKQFFDFLIPGFEKSKLKLRTILSLCLAHSEKFEHLKAIKKAEKAFNTSLDLLIQTLLVAYFYIFKNINKLGGINDPIKENRKLVKIEYFANFINTLKSIIKLVENMTCSKIKNSVYLNDMLFYERKLMKLLENKIENNTQPFSTITNFYKDTKSKTAADKENLLNMTSQNFNKQKDTILKRVHTILEKYKDKPDLIILNNKKVIESSFLNETTILTLSQLNYYNYSDVFVTNKLKNEITENSLLEKISFIVISLYVLATEHRFLEHKRNSENKFYKFLFDYIAEPKKRQSELYLGKAVEIAFTYLSDNFPFVSQIFNVFKKFELNRSKSIPENDEDNDYYKYLLPIKNGFRSELIIPVVKTMKQCSDTVFTLKNETKLKLDSKFTKKTLNPKKRLSSYKKRTTTDKVYQRRSTTGKRLKSSEIIKKNRTAVLMKNNNYLEKMKSPLLRTNQEFNLSKTADNFFKQKKKVPRKSSKQRSKIEKENLDYLPYKKIPTNKTKNALRPKSAKNFNSVEKSKKIKFSPIVQKYLSNKLQYDRNVLNKSNNSEKIVKNQQIDLNNVLQNNSNKLNINFTNVGSLNFVINSFANGTTEKKNSPGRSNKFKINKYKNANNKNLRKVFKNKSTLDEILNRFKSKI